MEDVREIVRFIFGIVFIGVCVYTIIVLKDINGGEKWKDMKEFLKSLKRI